MTINGGESTLSPVGLHAGILASRGKTRPLSAIPYQLCGFPRELAVVEVRGSNRVSLALKSYDLKEL